jgi:hypothetical protein
MPDSSLIAGDIVTRRGSAAPTAPARADGVRQRPEVPGDGLHGQRRVRPRRAGAGHQTMTQPSASPGGSASTYCRPGPA